MKFRLSKVRTDPFFDPFFGYYAYDATQQVTGVTTATKAVSYSYDAVGNRQAVTASGTAVSTMPGLGNYTTNNLNQYTSYGGASLAYDGNGNLLTAPGALFTFNVYDSKNRLVSATKGLEKIEFTYDYRNRCVERAYYTGSSLTQKVGLIYDGWSLIEETDLMNNTASATYVQGAGIDEIVSKTDVNGTIYYHQDGLGSTTALSNEEGQIVERYTYDIFGQATVWALGGLIITGSAYRNRFTYTGREWLGEIGLYDYRNRVYSAELGRFLQTDPILFQAGDVNIYRYVANDPVNWIDPEGLCGKKDNTEDKSDNDLGKKGGGKGGKPFYRCKKCSAPHGGSKSKDVCPDCYSKGER
jgi:RHS repeat-associated protein